MTDDQHLPPGWYTSQSGERRYWTGDTWVVPDPAGASAAPSAVPRRRAPWSQGRRRGLLIAGIAAVVLLGGGVTSVAVATTVDQQVAAARAQHAERHRAQVAAKKAAAAKAAAAIQVAADQAERDSRTSLITSLQKSVKKTAKEDVTKGLIDGPILSVSCTPLGGGSTDDLTQKTATLQCFAANRKNGDGTLNGYNFSATANWDTGEYTWRLGS